MTENLTVGERVAWYRRRRGMSQEVLAGLIGRTADWLQRAENNRIQLDRLSVIRSLAEMLDVSIGDLIGEPHPAGLDRRQPNPDRASAPRGPHGLQPALSPAGQ